MPPLVLFSLQFTLSLVIYVFIGFWYVRPCLARLPLLEALAPLVWVHAFRVIGGTILAPGSVDLAVPMVFRTMIGYGGLLTAVLALVALMALRVRAPAAVVLVWLCIAVGLADTLNAIIQSLSFDVFSYALHLNWVIVCLYVPALLVSSLLMVMRLLAPGSSAGSA